VNTEAKVGIFVIICLLLLGVTVYYVGNEQWGQHLTPYSTHLRYAGGVAAGSEVLFGGISAGRITKVRPWNQDPTMIEILFELKEDTPVNEKSMAKLGSVSLMSAPALSITTGAQDAPRLKAGQVIPSEETLSLDDIARKVSGIADSAQVLLAQVQGELKGISGQAQTLLANLNDATGPTNRRQLAEILQQVNTLMAEQSPKIDQITDQVLLLSKDADSTVKKIGPLVDHTDATVANVNATVSNVNMTIDQLRDPIRQDLAQLQATMEQAKSLIATIQTVVRSNDDNIRESVDNIRVATENLDQLTDQVKQRPWSLVRIRQPKDRKVPQ
jgi:phospholipid/cholesterol/gamma-HCH transport system substrate-binding protein